MHTFSISLNIYTLFFILVSRSSSGADYRYEACGPRSCGNGPNISFPFYIKGLQNPYCGFPGFMLNCSHGFPSLHLSETEYIVKEISYETRSLRVYDSAALSSDSDGCVPTIRNVSIPTAQFDFADNVTKLRFFSNCSDSMFGEEDADIGCDGGGRILALYEGDESVAAVLRNCETNSVAAVEDDGGGAEVAEVLRRGFVMKWRASECGKCEGSGGRCGFNETTYLFRCFCPNRPRYRSCRPEKNGSTFLLAAAIFGGAVCLLLCIFVTFLIWQYKKRRSKKASHATQSDAVESRSFYFGTKIFSYKELMEATDSFDSSKEVGDGGYGTVYHGKLSDGREVAVKRLHEHNYRRMEQFMNEIKILTSLRHKNLVSLYGCTSASSKELLLVYEYVANGTVSDHLHGGSSPLTWRDRMRIAVETAEALAYLHKSDIIHRDVKTSNILLDGNLSVKLADFGLSRLSSAVDGATHVSTAPQGTPGYVDPSYHKHYHLSSKSDVYSFGVVLVELVSSRPAVDICRPSDEINLASMAVGRIERGAFSELVDESLGFGDDAEIARMTTAVAELALRCLQAEKETRPCMDEVLSGLNEIRGGGRREFGVEMKNGEGCDLERVDVGVVKKREFESSPNAVTDLWVSDSTITTSF